MFDKKKALISIILAAFIGGSTATVTKEGLTEFPPLHFAFFRFVIASICVLPFFLKKEKHVPKNLADIIFISFLASLNIIFFSLGIGKTTATISQFLYAGIPLLTAIIVFFLHGEKVTSRKLLGISIGFTGVAIILLLPILEKGTAFIGNMSGNISIAGAVFSWTWYLTLSKRLLASKSPFVVTSYMIFVTTIVLFPLTLIESYGNYQWIETINATGIISLFFVALLSTVATFVLTQYAVKYGGAVLASMLYYVLPIIAFLSAHFLLGEGLNIGLVIGGILVLLGVSFVTIA